jgi:2-keto-3-deoxy-L-rhamnonate aldolase RhmA
MFDPAAPRLKPRLAAGETIGAHWFSLGSPALVEMALATGPDAVVIDLQHGLWDRAGLEAAVGMCPPAVPCLVRLADDSDAALSRALDAGAEGVIVPMVQSGEQAARAAAGAHYPPRGRRSAGGIRPFRDFAAYRAGTDAAIAVGVMIETAEAVADAAAIAAAPLVDFVFIGSGDLGLALGGDAARLEAAVAQVLAACTAAGKPCGIFTPSPAEARRRAAEGHRFVIACTDLIDIGHAFTRAQAEWRGPQS